MADAVRPKILIAEDEQIIAMDIQMRLENAGYQVVASVISGKDAVQKALEMRPDVVLMDIHLRGEMDGITAAEEIHHQLDIPVIYLTSYADRSTLERAKISEAYGYLLKPFEERTLLSTLDVVLYKHKLDIDLKQREAWFRGIVERNFDAIVSLDLEGTITYASPATTRISGYSHEELVGQPFLTFLSDVEAARIASIFAKTLQGEVVEGIELKLMLKSGEETYIEANAMPILVKEKVVGIQGIFRDITSRKNAELELQHMATHDYLTDLPNTRLFLEHLEKALARARRNGRHVALLYLDLDGFKNVNDTFGHSMGDHLLRLVAKRLEESVREVDIVCRLGGDEFAILMTDLPYLNHVVTLADRLHEAMQEPFRVLNAETIVTVSIGISTFPRDTQDSGDLIRFADQAMFYSKSMGKNTYYHFSDLKRDI